MFRPTGKVIGIPRWNTHDLCRRKGMDLIGELKDLQQKAMLFATERDREARWKGGFWLERQCDNLDARHRIMDGFNEEAKVELMAVVQIIFDMILHDKFEDEDWLEAMPEQTYDGDIEAVLRGIGQ